MPIDIQLKNDVRADKYGLVTVRNQDGTFNRQFRITEQELATLKASGNGVPPGVTRGEWEGGFAVVVGKAFDVGDITQDVARDQTPIYRAKIGERIDSLTGELTEDFVVIPVKDATGVFPNIGVAADKLVGNIVALQDGRVTIADGVLTKG